jgi:alanyl-tRNA synthetase
LPQKNIDVGLGFERIVAVAQGAVNNFETDLFAPLLKKIQELSGRVYGESADDDIRMRRVSDHSRAVFFCIADGAAPGREGRGYVVRKILRRAIRDGIELGLSEPFLAELIPAVQATMGAAYPEITEQESTISALVRAEEIRFREVYERGIARLDEFMLELKHQGASRVFPGEMAFKLHDSWGFPVDITEVIVAENGFEFDLAGFDKAMHEQRARARAGTDLSVDVFAESLASRLEVTEVKPTLFVGYDEMSCEASILALLDETGASVMALEAGDSGEVVLGRTPFYAEGGGQVGDSGLLRSADGEVGFKVSTTRKEGAYFIHCGQALCALKPAQAITAEVDSFARRATERHHTATHLMHSALQEVLGNHVNQAGSRVSPEGLRFDYTHPEAMSLPQLRQVEAIVQEQAMLSTTIKPFTTTLAKAKESGVTALFGEKYGNDVRVVGIGDFSQELCGGTHVPNTGWIGPFRITSDRALASGVRRIEAVAGPVAARLSLAEQDLLRELAQGLKCPEDRIAERVENLRKQLKDAKKLQKASGPSASDIADQLKQQADSFGWLFLEGLEADSLRDLAEALKNIDGLPAVSLLVGGDSKKVPFCFRCQPDSGFKAGDLAKALGQKLRGGGGGRPDFAQGQGSQGGDLKQAIQAFCSETLSST